MDRKAELVAAQCPSGSVILVAHSLGAVAPALVVRSGSVKASHVVLIEPALYDIARGHDAIEGHIGPMTRARAIAEEGDLFGYWEIVAPLMFGRPAARDRWGQDRSVAQRLADMDPPWGHGVSGTDFSSIPTLVVTGAWNDEYEVIAAQLVRAGAEHVQVEGRRHRPQDHPAFETILSQFVAGAT